MRKLLPPIILLLLPLATSAQVIKPAKPAFIVTYEENGKNVNESWNYSATIKFSVSNWSRWPSKVVNKPLEFDPGIFLKLEPGDIVNFYPGEINESGTGTGGHYTRVLTPDGTETVVETDGAQGTHTIIITDADYRNEHNIPTNEVYCLNARYYQLGNLAELERTETGAILRAYSAVGNNLSEWAVSQETMEQVFPKVETFILTEKDIKAWQQISRTNVGSGSYNDENLTIKLSVKMNVETAEVTLEGCSELGAGEEGKVTATGKPGGGTYEFWVEPSDLMSVDASGSSATLKGSRPGRGTLYVEYTSPDGSKAQTSQPASMVSIYDFNGGEAIPQIPLYDIDGNRLSGKLKIPYGSQPDEAQELVDFITGNPSVFTAVADADNIELQGLAAGKATLGARDNCGNKTGPVVEVEVVNCDKETIAKLEEMLKIATENQQQQYKNISKILGSKEFEEAANNIKSSTIKLAEKTGMLIIGLLSGEAEASAAAATTAKILEALVSFKDILTSDNYLELTSNELQVLVSQFGSDAAQTIAGSIEAGTAAIEFGTHLGKLIGTDIELQNAIKMAEQANHQIENIVKQMVICRKGKEEPGKNDAEAETNAMLPPQKPPQLRQVGLPYMPEDCGCGKEQGLEIGQTGFSTLQAGMQNLSKCADDFNKGPLDSYKKSLEDWKSLTGTFGSAAKSGPAELKKIKGESLPRIESIIEKTKSFDTAGRAFYEQIKSCPGSMDNSVELLRSAETITVDSIKTNY